MKHEPKAFDLSTVEKQKNFIIPEEFPEGPYGSSFRMEAPVENKSTPWEEGQRSESAFNYENKSLHENLARRYPGSHPVHDDPEHSEQAPYSTSPE